MAFAAGVRTVGQRIAAVAALAMATLPFAVHCAHDRSRCEPVRRPAPVATPPSDPGTARAVEQEGFRYERCEIRARYRLVRPGTRALTADEMRAVVHNLLPATSEPRGIGIGTCVCETKPMTPEEKSLSCVSISLRAGDLDPP